MDEGRDEGLIEFEVGGEAVEVQDEGFEAEGGGRETLEDYFEEEPSTSRNMGIKSNVYFATPSSRFR